MTNYKKSLFLFAIICALILFPGCSGSGSKPNVVLIIIDTLRADKLGAYGFKSAVVSPELDKFSAEGFTFDRVISQASWTRPSIGSFLTSKYPRSIGLYKEQWDVLPDDLLTAGEFFSNNGYKTIGVTANPNINRIFGFAQGFDSYTDSEILFRWMGKEEGKKTVKDGRHFEKARIPATDVFGRALEEAKASKGPLFLQLNIMEVHGGRIVPDSEVDADLKGLKDSGYLQMVRVASREVGKFVEQFNREVSDNTLYFIVADHGEGLSDHPTLRKSEGHGAYLYESTVVVPWIVYSPRIREFAGKRFPKQVQLLDLLPTMAEMAGLKPADEFDGVSLAPIIQGKQADVVLPEVAQTETMMQSANKVAVYGKDWKYIENRDGWKWLPPTELQAKGGGEQGAATSKLDQQPEEAKGLKGELSAFESGYSARPAQVPDEDKLTKGELDRLRSLGYIK
jgi:arylsulfatase A-like enzyme